MQSVSAPRKTPAEAVRDVGITTAMGIVTRFVTMPLESVFVKRSFHDCTKTYAELFRENVFNLKQLRYLQTEVFSRNCLLPTAYKVLSNSGVAAYIEVTRPDLRPFAKGVRVMVLSTLFETLTTTPGEWNKTLALDEKTTGKRFNAFNIQNLCNRNYHRCLRASLIRSSWSAFFTYGGLYGVEECVKPFFPKEEHSAHVKVFSAVVGPMIPQCIIMPGNNLQTYVFRNPDLPWKVSIKQCLADYKVVKIIHVYRLAKGFEMRMAHRGIGYGVTYFIIEILKGM